MTNFEANRLKNLQNNLEKNENIILENIAKYENNSQLCEIQKELFSLRENEVLKLKAAIKNIIIPLRKIKCTIYDDTDVDQIDLKQLKNEMISIQSNIQDLKINTKNKLELLEKEESILSSEVDNYEQKLPEWGQPLKYLCSTEYKIQKSMSAKQHGSVCQEVKEFMDFLTASGGHENGWSVEDHRLFLKVRQKSRTPEEMAENLHAFLPDIDISEILVHEKWYIKYLQLKTKHKAAILNWRTTKSATVSCSKPAARTVSFKQKSEIYSKEEIRKKLAAWKEEKQDKILRQKEYEIQRKMKQKELQQLKRQQNEKMKQSLSTWKYSRLVKVQEEKLERESKELQDRIHKASLANRLIKLYQLNDNIFIERMKQNRLFRTKSENKIKTNDKTTRDPERIFKPTKQWLSRIEKNDNDVNLEHKNTCNLTSIPKLGVPTWRKSIL